MTRLPDKAETLRVLGAEPVVCDVYNADQLITETVAFGPEVVMHQVTDLPDERRAEVLDQVRALVTGRPEPIELPYVCELYVWTRIP